MILYDLKCRKDHVFETWFRDSAAYDEQAAAGAIACPTCGSRKVEKNCDYVGGNFAEEARKIHYGEQDPRNIYGETSDQQAKELHEEGVSFNRIPWAPRQDS